MRSLLILVVLLFNLPGHVLADDAELPPKAILPTRKFDATVERAKSQHRQAIEQALRVYIAELEAAKAKSEGSEATAIGALILKARKELNDLTTTWQVVFRGQNPAIWGQDFSEDEKGQLAVKLSENRKVALIRLTNVESGESVFVRCNLRAHDLYSLQELPGGWIWNGGEFFGELVAGKPDTSRPHGWKLGLANKAWKHGYKDKATIAGDKYGFGGYGFARRNLAENHPGLNRMMWADELVEPFTLEISISSVGTAIQGDERVLNSDAGKAD